MIVFTVKLTVSYPTIASFTPLVLPTGSTKGVNEGNPEPKLILTERVFVIDYGLSSS